MSTIFGVTTSPPSPGQGARHAGLDLARLVLSICVVLLHSGLFNALGRGAEFAFNNGIVRIAVPFFFLMAGFYFPKDTRAAFHIWLRRVLIIYLCWWVLYLPIMALYQPPVLSRVLLNTAFGFFHLWFLPALIGGGILLHLVRRYADRTLLLLAVSAVIIGAAIQYGENRMLDWPSGPERFDLLNITRNFLFLGFPFMAFGLLLSRRPDAFQMSVAKATWVLAAALVVLFAESALNLWLFPNGGFFDIYVSLILAGPALLIWAHLLPIWTTGRRLRDLSALIYFSHAMFLFPLRENFGLGALELTAAVLLLCFVTAPLFIFVSRKVPLL